MIDNNLEFDFNDIDVDNKKADYKKEIGITSATITGITIKTYEKMSDSFKIMEISYKSKKGNFSKGSIFFSGSLQDVTVAKKTRYVDCKGNSNMMHILGLEELELTDAGKRLIEKSALDRKIDITAWKDNSAGKEEQLKAVLDGFRPMLKGEKEWITIMKNLINYNKDLIAKKDLIDVSPDWSSRPLVPSLKKIYDSDVEDLTASFAKFLKNEVVICNVIKILNNGKEYMEALSEVDAIWKFDEASFEFDEENPSIKTTNSKGEEVILQLDPNSKRDQATIKKLIEKKLKATKNFNSLKKFFESQAKYKVDKSKEQMIFLPVISMDYFEGCQEMEGAITNIKSSSVEDDSYAEETSYEIGDEPNF